ncbi:hypothetical protein QL919_12455 [Psychrobacter sp. APC 3426]|uniref:DarT1-associated NADAR antitoxin family protein n=1 Tax=Psychrobacter sp. APC 3426 TaxID=3035177 RepID=UPI0025B5C140|nr:hypothetical protein [Psychrobacter sp. APC 3426]MDN3399538.1 hypothetical protein [Psychrobacter sp. APC 3426]
MANRPVFIPGSSNEELVVVENLDFEWFAGFSVAQKKKSVESLHCAFKEKYPNKSVLEISSKSESELGIMLSAFNLQIDLLNGHKASVESLYQSSKVFQEGGPYDDIRYKSSLEAKRDERLKNSGDVVAFEHKGDRWGIEPKTAFYNWLYLNVLNLNSELKNQVLEYDAFTDIEFNPKKSFSCQANAIALYVALRRNKILEDSDSIPNKKEFLKLVTSFKYSKGEMQDLFD